jgi:hypothetical protein
MQCNRSNSFSRQSGKTSRESQQSRQLCQSRKSRQARQVHQSDDMDQKNLQTTKFEFSTSSSSDSEEEQQFGTDKISRKEMAKLSECFVSKTRISRQSKQSTILEEYENLS